MRVLLAAILALMLAGPAFAAAPAPKKPIQVDRFAGRWHEIVRTPNPRQKNCFAAFVDWTRQADGSLKVVNQCRKGSPAGKVETFSSVATVLDAAKARVSMAFFGGVVKQEYWILDRADDYSWAIMGTPGGNYVWGFTRKANLTAAERAALIARIKALGYDTGKLEVVGR